MTYAYVSRSRATGVERKSYEILSCITEWKRSLGDLVVDWRILLSHVTVTKKRVWIGNNNNNTIADLHNLQSFHTNLFSLSAVVLTDL
jgi:hypothetical protein